MFHSLFAVASQKGFKPLVRQKQVSAGRNPILIQWSKNNWKHNWEAEANETHWNLLVFAHEDDISNNNLTPIFLDQTALI